MLSAGKVARRYERDGDLASLVLGASSRSPASWPRARALFARGIQRAFRELAGLERVDRESLLISADRFTRESDKTTVSAKDRRILLSRFPGCSAFA